MRLTKRLFIMFLALWLPVSVVAAGGMATSMSGQPSHVQPGAVEGCPQHAAEQASNPDQGDCHSCSFCHFACTALIAVHPQAFGLGSGWVAASFAVSAPRPYVPDRLQRPPLAP